MQEITENGKKIEAEFKQYSAEMLNLCGDLATEMLKGNYDIHQISVSLTVLVNLALKTHQAAKTLENQNKICNLDAEQFSSKE